VPEPAARPKQEEIRKTTEAPPAGGPQALQQVQKPVEKPKDPALPSKNPVLAQAAQKEQRVDPNASKTQLADAKQDQSVQNASKEKMDKQKAEQKQEETKLTAAKEDKSKAGSKANTLTADNKEKVNPLPAAKKPEEGKQQ